MLRSRVVPVVSFVVVALMLAGAWILPIPWWVLTIPAVILAVSQIIALTDNSVSVWAFPVGDYVYYLGIGTVLGLGSLVVENTVALSDRLDENTRIELEERQQATQTRIEQTKIQIEAQLETVQRAQDRLSDVTERGVQIDPATFLACEQARIQLDLENSLNFDPLGSDDFFPDELELPPPECLAVQGEILAIPSATAGLEEARSRLADLRRILSEANAELDQINSELTVEIDGDWPWENLTDEQKNLLLFDLFPCLLLIGVAIKIGKTTASLPKTTEDNDRGGRAA